MQKHPKTIMVYCPNWVGDVVMATPVFDCLRLNYPETKLIGVIKKYVRGVVEDGPWFDRVIDFNGSSIRDFIKLAQKINLEKPDFAILLPNSIRSFLITKLGGAKKIYGYQRDGRSIFLSGGPKPVRAKSNFLPVPMVEYYMQICRWLDLKIPENIKPCLYLSEPLQKKGNQLLSRYGIIPTDMVIGINPGAKFGSSKCWPPEYFAILTELLIKQYNCKILLFAGPGEEKIANKITKLSKSQIINTAPDKVDLALLKHLIKRCDLLITNDTGPRHYAVAFNIPVVVIMGPTDPRYTAANLDKTVVLRKDLNCSPCHKKKCPLQHECMTLISPEAVFDESKTLLNYNRLKL